MPGSGPSRTGPEPRPAFGAGGQGPDTAAGYDRVAAEYARRIAGELAGKPFDRALLDRFADQTRGRGTVADLGCGPGHIAAYLHARGVEVVGIDLSPGMVEQARRLYPEIGFRQGDMRALDAPDGAFAGAVAFYSIIHLPAAERPATFAELARVLGPGAPLLVAFHVGDHTVHVDQLWDHQVSLDFTFLPTAVVAAELEGAGLAVEEALERDPYAPEVEHQSRRAYLLARRREP